MYKRTCSSCGVEMLDANSIWSGYWRCDSYHMPNYYTLGITANKPKAEFSGRVDNIVIEPKHFVCPNCGEVKLALSPRQLELYTNVVNEYVELEAARKQREEMKASNKKGLISKIFKKD